jgi:hypothetical protein
MSRPDSRTRAEEPEEPLAPWIDPVPILPLPEIPVDGGLPAAIVGDAGEAPLSP